MNSMITFTHDYNTMRHTFLVAVIAFTQRRVNSSKKNTNKVGRTRVCQKDPQLA